MRRRLFSGFDQNAGFSNKAEVGNVIVEIYANVSGGLRATRTEFTAGGVVRERYGALSAVLSPVSRHLKIDRGRETIRVRLRR